MRVSIYIRENKCECVCLLVCISVKMNQYVCAC